MASAPHDTLVKEYYQHPENAQGLIKLGLAPVDMPVCNLHNVPEEHLRTDMLQNAMLLLMKALLEQDSARRIAQVLHLIHTTYTSVDIRDALELFFNYLAQARPEITIDSVDEELSKLPGGIDMGQTFQEQWADYSFKKGAIMGEARGEARGEAKGEAKGEARGRHTLLTRQLTRKFGEHALTPTIQHRMQSATIDQLDYWGERLLDAHNVDDVFLEQ